MILSVNQYQIDILIKKDSNHCYIIPKYQREYTWGQKQWQELYDDIEENSEGYFIGSISSLSNLAFIEKRDRTNKDKRYVGYKNGLEINKELAEKDSWTVKDIEDRTETLVNQLVEMYKL